MNERNMDALQLVWHQARYEIMQQIKYTKILKSINLLKDFCRPIWKLDWKIGKYVYAFNQIEYKMCMYCNIFIFVFFFIKDIKSGPAMSTWGEVSVDSKVKIPFRSVQLVEIQQYLRTEIGSMLWGFFQFGAVGGNFHFFKFAIKISAIKTCIFLFCNVIMIPDQKMSETSAATGNGSKSICLFFKNIIDCVYLYSSQRLL